MLVKMEELKNIVVLGKTEMLALVANEPEEVGGSFQNTSLCSQNVNLLDNGAITLDIENEAIFFSEKAFVTAEGKTIFNSKCSENFIRNKDIPYLFSDLLNLCMTRGYEIFRCHVQNVEKDRIITIAFSMPLAVLCGELEDLRKISINVLSDFMEELIPFLDGINEKTPDTGSLENFGYEINHFKVEDKDKAFLEIDPATESVSLKYVDINILNPEIKMEFKLGENSTIEDGLVIENDTLILVDIKNRAMLNHSNPMVNIATAAYILEKGEEGFKIIPGHGACSFIKAKYLSGFKDLIFKYDNSLNAVVISHKE